MKGMAGFISANIHCSLVGQRVADNLEYSGIINIGRGIEKIVAAERWVGTSTAETLWFLAP